MRFAIVTRADGERPCVVRSMWPLNGRIFVIYLGTYDPKGEWLPVEAVNYVTSPELNDWFNRNVEPIHPPTR